MNKKMKQKIEQRFQIKVIPRSKKSIVVPTSNGEVAYRVYVRSPAEKGLGNEEVRELLSTFFKIPVRLIIIERGLTSRYKTILILSD